MINKTSKQTKLLQNKVMTPEVYALRRQIINLIHEANRIVPLPRIEVRVTDNHHETLGCARLGERVMWITERSVASRQVVFHEILHAVFGQKHVAGCPLMNGSLSEKNPLSDIVCNRLFKKYATEDEYTERARANDRALDHPSMPYGEPRDGY